MIKYCEFTTSEDPDIEQSYLNLHCLLRYVCPNIKNNYISDCVNTVNKYFKSNHFPVQTSYTPPQLCLTHAKWLDKKASLVK